VRGSTFGLPRAHLAGGCHPPRTPQGLTKRSQFYDCLCQVRWFGSCALFAALQSRGNNIVVASRSGRLRLSLNPSSQGRSCPWQPRPGHCPWRQAKGLRTPCNPRPWGDFVLPLGTPSTRNASPWTLLKKAVRGKREVSGYLTPLMYEDHARQKI